MSRCSPTTTAENAEKFKMAYSGVAYVNAVFWLFCTAGINSDVAGIQTASFRAMENIGILNRLERELDPKAAIAEAQLIFACLTMNLLALAGAMAAAVNIVDAIRNPLVGAAKKLILASDSASYTNAVAWLIWIALTAADVGHTRQMTLNTMVKAGILTELETRVDPTAGIRAAQLISGCAAMLPFALRHIASDVSKVAGAIGRLFCTRGNQVRDESIPDIQQPLVVAHTVL